MREHKFRLWSKEKKQMIYDDFIAITLGGKVIYESDYDGEIVEWNPEYFALMQYTGLKDKNGKEIYEGDFVKYTRKNWQCFSHPDNGTDVVHVVEIYFDNKRNVISGRVLDLTRKGQPPYMASGVMSNDFFRDSRAEEIIIEVIGNIFENPDLLEAAK